MSEIPTYREPKASIEDRVNDLLSRMTLPEKAGQMIQLDGRGDMEKEIPEKNPGSLLQVLDHDILKLQELASKTRLGIPLLMAIDAIHGHSFKEGATIFPTQIGIASTWNSEAARAVGRITAIEMSYTGVHWTFSPVLCIARDTRWGRVGETFGEDPLLIGELAAAMIQGYQGKDLSDPRSVLACAKHYAGYSETRGGYDSSEADLSERKLRSYFFAPFERAARQGCATFMTGYQSIEGVPCTANKWLMTDVLRDEWAFQGIVVTDWDNVDRMRRQQYVYETLEEASVAAVKAGNDLIMSTPGFYDAVIGAVGKGLLKESELDRAVRRILRVKFSMGLFENPRLPDPKGAKAVIGCTDHRSEALRCARESIVLLKNENYRLPLKPSTLKRIAVIGPNADDDFAQLGDWTLGTGQGVKGTMPRELTVTTLDGIKSVIGTEAEVVYEKGCSVVDNDESGIPAARQAAKNADVAVVVLGDHFQYVGEFKSTATLELMGAQKALLRALHGTGTPVVAVLINSKPLIIGDLVECAEAIIEAWNPGMLGGQAIAEVLFGTINPSGRLPISFPCHAGQIPVYYNQVPGQHHINYGDLTSEPQYAFGYGLSYTEFTYADLTLETSELRNGDTLKATVKLANTGNRSGIETVQVYLRDMVTSATWPRKKLIAYKRRQLQPGENETVEFTIPSEAMSIIDAQSKRVVEPGEFELLVGGSSREEDLSVTRFRLKSD